MPVIRNVLMGGVTCALIGGFSAMPEFYRCSYTMLKLQRYSRKLSVKASLTLCVGQKQQTNDEAFSFKAGFFCLQTRRSNISQTH